VRETKMLTLAGKTRNDKQVLFSESTLSTISLIANRPSRDRGYTRSFYSYPAKFLAHLPHELIRLFTDEGDLVYDAYSGGGTTGLESLLLNRRFVGYDINPFAILISNVKTKRLDRSRVDECGSKVSQPGKGGKREILDEDDRMLLGTRISTEVEQLAYNIDALNEESEYKDFFKLALIHSIKLVGRRDFDARISAVDQTNLTAFSSSGANLPAGASILPLFVEKVRKMKEQMLSLPPRSKYRPQFVLGSNHKTHLEDATVDLIVTSPPYKDLDVEYQQIQIQRPESHRSKRSDVISAILGVEPVDKAALCGFKNDEYWTHLVPSVKECHRVSKRGSPVFFWVGLKSIQEKEQFGLHLEEQGFRVIRTILVQLSKDRAASSRSLHHGKDTGMLESDFLYVTQRE
jgi:DNA modification methylase